MGVHRMYADLHSKVSSWQNAGLKMQIVDVDHDSQSLSHPLDHQVPKTDRQVVHSITMAVPEARVKRVLDVPYQRP